MRSVTNTLATALTQPERVIAVRVKVDWDNDGYNGDGSIDDLSSLVSSGGIQQVLTTQVPAIAQPVAGAAVAQLTANLDQGHPFGVQSLPFVRNITSTPVATGSGTITASRGAVQPGDVVLAFIAEGGTESYNVPTGGMNVTWNTLALRSDTNGTTPSHLITAGLLVRRIGNTTAAASAEPSTYTFTCESVSSYVVHIVVIGGNVPGIHAYTVKGTDAAAAQNQTYTLLTGPAITTTLDSSLLLGFFAGYAAAGGGVTWTAQSPATKIADSCSSSGATSNAATCVTSQTVNAGTYQPGATISVATEPGVVFYVAFSPYTPGDETQNAAWTFSELNAKSLLAGKYRDARNVTAALDVATAAGVESVPLFTGRSLGVDVQSRSRRAVLTALDNRELMRNDPYTLTQLQRAVIAESPVTQQGETLPAYPGLEATWLVSYIFSNCRTGQIGGATTKGAIYGDGFFASPKPRLSTSFHIPCHGSLWPFIGTLSFAYLSRNGNNQRVTFQRGPWVAATSPVPQGSQLNGKWNVAAIPNFFKDAGLVSSTSATAGRIELYMQQTITGAGTMSVGAYGTTYGGNIFAFLDLTTAGALQLRVSMGGITRTVAGPSWPTDKAFHACGVHWDSSTGVVTFKIDSTVTTTSMTTFTNATAPSDVLQYMSLTATDGVSVAEIQLSGGYISLSGGAGRTNDFIRATDAWAWDNFTPSAFIDKSENTMDSVVPFSSGTDCWGVVASLAEAEFASVYFDGDGYPHYRTRYSDVTAAGQTVQRTLTVRNALKDVDYQSGIDQLVNSFQVPYTPIATTVSGTAWQPSSPVRVPAGGSTVINFTMPGLTIFGPGSAIFSTANTAPDGTGTVISSNFTISGTVTGMNGTVTLTNTNTQDIWMVHTDGSPSIGWTATWVTTASPAYTSTIQDSDSILRHGVQTAVNGIATNDFRQRLDVATTLAYLLLTDLANPRPVLTNIKVVGDPRLQLGDLVNFVDPDGLGLNGNYRVVGISPSFSSSDGFTQVLVARFSAACGIATWDQTYWDDCTVWGA